ncbi:MBL fold metallo-hydrolase [Aestuariispira insulae]|uniref:Glyoxylase-like metal-dependent hydrolase (Beta-lactamase superfamily II) n=1 Tax=Aestuariispira insulae TaxID=1461337 RepID=A0A3D9HQ00_9PROT|nr:MBL fold metallo-hydrolase [Aestuariispira insulae]RED51567.1 glyoxylase-like metal-dependent hydrolase (beta-lactamase superfamily II) [Aestuariispira insulae]
MISPSLSSRFASTVSAAALLTAGLLMASPVFQPGMAHAESAAMAAPMEKAQAGFYRLRVGDVNVIAVSDGTVPLDMGVLHGDADHVHELLVRSHQASPVQTSVNAYLIELEDRLVMVDAGTADRFGPSLDKLEMSIRNAGYTPDDITDILITHIHLDHAGGLAAHGKMRFPNATIHVDKTELDFWMDTEQQAKAADHHKPGFDMAREVMTPYLEKGQVNAFEDHAELFPGLTTIPTPGHTPGHSFYQLESKGEKLVFWGDIMHVAEVQFPDPSVTILFDIDPKAAETQRKRVFADAAKNGTLVAPAHVSFPGFGRLRADGDSYDWLPVTYVNDAVIPSN